MTYLFLKDPAQAGVYHLPPMGRQLFGEQARQAQLTELTVNTANCEGLPATLEEIGRALHFPSWYGANLDALNDCLTDPDWQAGLALALHIEGLETLRHNDPEALASLLEVFDTAAWARSQTTQPLWILLDMPARGISTLPDA